MDNTLTRLQRGQVVELFGREHVVVMVNDCRARCVPLAKKTVDYETRFGKRVSFETNEASHNICPNSEIPILCRKTEKELLEMGIAEVKNTNIETRI